MNERRRRASDALKTRGALREVLISRHGRQRCRCSGVTGNPQRIKSHSQFCIVIR